MSNSNLDQRAKAGKRQLGLCVAALMGVYLFALGVSWLLAKNLSSEGPMIAIGIVLLMFASQGKQWARVILGCWVGYLALGQFVAVAAQILRDHEPSAWAPFKMVIGFIYLVAALVLLISPDIRAYEHLVEHPGEAGGGWEPVAPEPATSPRPTPNESFRPPSASSATPTHAAPEPATTAPAPAAPLKAPAPQFPLACTACNRLSPAGSTHCVKCGKPFPRVKVAAPTA